MKNKFKGYYAPTPHEYERLWSEGLIVLDTNVLLNLYRLPATARGEVLSALELIKDKLWIPYQVALEFQRRRLTVISGERKNTEDVLTSAKELVNNLKKKVDNLQLDKRGLEIVSQPLLADLENASHKIMEAIEKAHEAQFDISASDPLRDALDDLFDSRVGEGPSTQEELDALVADGDKRYSDKIPPGFEDADKDKNPREATFISDEITYQRKFGDLILWRQLIKHVYDNNIKNVLFVTGDLKDDWWWREQGKTIGPHPELIREIMRKGKVELFWMYTSIQFVEHAIRYSKAKFSDQSVTEIQNFSNQDFDIVLGKYFSDDKFGNIAVHRSNNNSIHETLEGMVIQQWLFKQGRSVEKNKNFPDFIEEKGDLIRGYEVCRIKPFEIASINSELVLFGKIVNFIHRGINEGRGGRFSEFVVIMVIPQAEYVKYDNSDKVENLHKIIFREIVGFPYISIVVGSIFDSSFEVLYSNLKY